MHNESESKLNTEFAGRLVTLCDGRPGLRCGLRAEVREPASAGTDGPPILEFIASTETLDRYGEILVASGWQLEAYRRNPVFQNAHQYGDILFTLGKALATEVRDHRLWQRIEFAVEANPMARIAYRLYQGGFLNAVSVGFIPRRWENGGPEAGFRRKYLEQELLEVSAVAIPANPDALRLGLRTGAVRKADLEQWLELLRGVGATGLAATRQPTTPFGSPPAVPGTHAGASGARNNEAQGLLQFARDLARLLRAGGPDASVQSD